MNPQIPFVEPAMKYFGSRRSPSLKVLFAVIVLTLSMAPISRSATIIVNSDRSDSVHDGRCSLAEAVVNANTDSAVESDCPAGDGVDTIILDRLSYQLSDPADESGVIRSNSQSSQRERSPSAEDDQIVTRVVSEGLRAEGNDDAGESDTENVESGAGCASAAGSTADSGAAGFCLVADLESPLAAPASLAVANENPATGLQLLQATFTDGSSLGGVIPVDANSRCTSAAGSSADSESPGGFCFVADLSIALADVASFSLANALPVAGLQFLQVSFANSTVPRPDGSLGAECESAAGSGAALDEAGFCISADLSADGVAARANFAFANEFPVTGFQFVQVTFGDVSPPGVPDLFVGAECLSAGGSTANSGIPNAACLASDLESAPFGSANLAFTNGLRVTGLQFLQATFSEDAPGGPGAVPADAVCVSDGGSTATAGSTAGFCLVSDLSLAVTDSAQFAVANDIPIADFEFVQVPFVEESIGSESLRLLRNGMSQAVAVSDAMRLPVRGRFRPLLQQQSPALRRILNVLRRYPHLRRHLPPALDGVAQSRPRYFHLSNRRFRSRNFIRSKSLP